MHWFELLPDIQEARELRDVTGCGLADGKKQLLRQNMERALMSVDPQTPTEQALVAVLRAALHEGML